MVHVVWILAVLGLLTVGVPTASASHHEAGEAAGDVAAPVAPEADDDADDDGEAAEADDEAKTSEEEDVPAAPQPE